MPFLNGFCSLPHRRKEFGIEGSQATSQATIGKLPDEVLLEIFKLYVNDAYAHTEEWQTLAHVCQRWRHVVFASPHCLDLRLLCTSRSRVREMLDVWPPLPIDVKRGPSENWYPESSTEGVDNIIAALERSDRVHRMILDARIPSQLFERFVDATQHPFPALTDLELWFWTNDEITGTAPLIPESFLGGSAPRLQTLVLANVAFPSLPKFLPSANGLVELTLFRIPNFGYISPEALVTTLSFLTRLKSFDLWYLSPRSHPSQGSRQRPPITRTILPALTRFSFRGIGDYVEDFVARIDAPSLNTIHITFFHQLILGISQVTHFINRVKQFDVLYQAKVTFKDSFVEVEPFPEIETLPHPRVILGVSCAKVDWQLSSLAQLCSLPLVPISELEHLRIDDPVPWGLGDIENSQWLALLHPFMSVKSLHLRERVGLGIVTTCKD